MTKFMDGETVKEFFKTLKNGGLEKIKGFTPLVSDRDHIDDVLSVLEGKMIKDEKPLVGSKAGAYLWRKADHYRGVQTKLKTAGMDYSDGISDSCGIERINTVLNALESGSEINAQQFYAAMTTALLNGALQY